MTSRTYNLGARATAQEATRDRIVEVTKGFLMDRWYDEMTLRDIAAESGVSLQTVVNHFGSKDGVAAAAVESLSEDIIARRGVEPGDIAAAVGAIVDDYELTGDMTIRALALAERIPVIASFMEIGAVNHREWVERFFAHRLPRSGAAREVRVTQYAALLDVYMWKLMRRDRGMTQDEAAAAMLELVEALDRTNDNRDKTK